MPVPAAAVETYMVHAVLVTLLCCLPLGIVAILKASDVSKRQAAGDYVGARAASEEAKNWVLASVIFGLIAIVIIIAAGA